MSPFDKAWIKAWYELFRSFKGGPDWILERTMAESRLDRWRRAVLHEWRRWEAHVKWLKDQHKSLRQRKLEDFISVVWVTSAHYRYHSPNLSTWSIYSRPTDLPESEGPLTLPPPPLWPIIQEICMNTNGSFSGFGRYLANNFLLEMAIFPGMPSHVLCANQELFERFKTKIYEYLIVFSSSDFLDQVTTTPSSGNPFEFNETSNYNYIRSYVTVFRRTAAKVKSDLYIDYCRQGLFDRHHIIGGYCIEYAHLFQYWLSPGQEYPKEKAEQWIVALINTKKRKKNTKSSMTSTPSMKSFKWKWVYLYEGSLHS